VVPSPWQNQVTLVPSSWQATIKRRADVIDIFPNPAAFLRLATAVVIEVHDEWQVTRRYLSDVSMKNYALSSPLNTPRQHLPDNTKSPSVQHDSLIATREPRQIRGPPLAGTLSACRGWRQFDRA
jgi:hypothetical protein